MIEWMFLLAGTLAILLPVGVALYLRKRVEEPLIVLTLGGIMYLVSMVRLPLNIVVGQELGHSFSGTALVVASAFFPALTTGIFEEGCRYAGYRYIFRPDARTFHNGLIYGTGHGGTESILLGGANNIAMFLFLLYAPHLLPALTLGQVQAMPLYMPLVSALERSLVLVVQIGLSVVVLQCFVKRSRKYLLYAVGFHTLVDFSAAMAAQKSVLLTEVVFAVFALVAVYLIFRIGREPPETGNTETFLREEGEEK